MCRAVKELAGYIIYSGYNLNHIVQTKTYQKCSLDRSRKKIVLLQTEKSGLNFQKYEYKNRGH